MNKPAPIVSIGITAYNEEANIAVLLKAIFSQKQQGFKVKELLVISDGSTDRTNQILKEIKNPLLKITLHKKRGGKGTRVKEITRKARGDVLIVFDADTFIKDELFILKLIKPILIGKADLTSARINEITPTTLAEEIFFVSMQIKKRMFEKYKNGNNPYTCRGSARAFSHRFYKNFRAKNTPAEDTYSYFSCILNGYKYQYVKNTSIYYQLPETLKEHEKQSVRFFQSQKKLTRYFPSEFVQKQFSFPLSVAIEPFFYYLLKKPLYTTLYMPVVVYMKIRSFGNSYKNDIWNISTSTKKLKLS